MSKNIINHKSQTELSSFSVVYHGSTLNEKPGWYGLSHLMEHLICKSFDKYLDEYDMYGVNSNAYTSDTNVVFYIQGLEEHIVKFRKDFLKSIVSGLNITQEELDNEIKIVLEEYADTFNDQGYSHVLNLFRKKYNRYTAIGLKEDIENITLDDINEFYDEYFKKPSKIINIVNKECNFIDEKDFPFIKEYGTTYKNEKVVFGNYDVDLDINNTFNDKDSVVGITKTYTENYAEYYFLSLMLSNGLNSPLIQELREKRGLLYSLGLNIDNLNDNQFYMYLMTQTRKGNGEEVIDIIKEVFSNPDKYLTKEKFNIIKNKLLVTYKKIDIERYKNINKFIKQPQFLVQDKLKDITYESVMKVFNSGFNLDNWYFSIDHDEFKD